MSLIPDMTNVEASGGGPGYAPPGKHLMMVKDVEVSKSAAGNEVHTVTASCMEQPNVDRIATENFTVSHPVGLSRYKGLIQALGFSSFAGLDSEMLKGKVFVATVGQETFTGREGKQVTTSKIQGWEPGKDAFARFVQGQRGCAPVGAPTAAPGGTPAPNTPAQGHPVSAGVGETKLPF